MDRFETELGKWVVKHRWWLMVATLLTVLAAASGVRLLTFNNDLRVFFSEENPQLRALEALENTYNKIDNVLFVIAPKNGDVFTRETLAAVEELTEASWQIPYSSRVDSLTNYQHTRAEEDELIVEDLVVNAMSLSAADLERARLIALSEPQLVNRRISPSGHVTGVNVNVLLPGKSIEEVPEVVRFARGMAADFRETHSDIDLYLTGMVMIDNAYGEVGQGDISTLVPLMYLTLVVIVGLALRSLIGTFATLTIILISMATGMGLAGWFRFALNPASVNAPTIILTLAVADSVHILATVFREMRLGKSKHDAIAESVRVNVQPVFLTSATTTIGFLSMNFSDAPPFRDLGNIVSMGVVAAFVYSVFFLPPLMAVLPVRVKRKTEVRCAPCDRLANFVIHRQNLVLWGSVVVIAALTAGILRVELNDDWIQYFDERYDIRRANDFAQKHLTGYDAIEYSLQSGETSGIHDPEYLATVEAFANWYREQPKVIHVDTITNTMKRLNRNMHGDDDSFYRLPGERELAAQYLLLYEMSLPFGLDLNNQIDVDRSATRMVAFLRGTTTREVREMDQRAREWLRINAPREMFTYGSGLSIMWAHISERNIKAMLGASFGALALISILLIFALRSFKLGLLSLVPNLAPAFAAFGVWGIAVGQVGLALSVIVAMTLGIVVDDSVHFMSKYLRARRENDMSPSDSVRYSFNTVGTAMWVTTVALVAGFMVLSLSGFKMNSDMGLMTALTITFALALDFLLLPTLLVKVEAQTDERIALDISHIPPAVPMGSGRRHP